jgi:DNA helicase-2/ATP-dependent DNA helicase PcrA
MVKNRSLRCLLPKYGRKNNCPLKKVFISDEVMLEFRSLDFAVTTAPEIAKMEADFVTRAMEKFVMNVTALNNYLKCPLEFYFKESCTHPFS